MVNEMLQRGYEFLPIRIGKSRAKTYTVEDGKIRLPFMALKGLGDAAANTLEKATLEGQQYISAEDLQSACNAICATAKNEGHMEYGTFPIPSWYVGGHRRAGRLAKIQPGDIFLSAPHCRQKCAGEDYDALFVHDSAAARPQCLLCFGR